MIRKNGNPREIVKKLTEEEKMRNLEDDNEHFAPSELRDFNVVEESFPKIFMLDSKLSSLNIRI